MSTWGWSKGALPRLRPAGISSSLTGGCSSPAQVRMGVQTNPSAWGHRMMQPYSSQGGVGVEWGYCYDPSFIDGDCLPGRHMCPSHRRFLLPAQLRGRSEGRERSELLQDQRGFPALGHARSDRSSEPSTAQGGGWRAGALRNGHLLAQSPGFESPVGSCTSHVRLSFLVTNGDTRTDPMGPGS